MVPEIKKVQILKKGVTIMMFSIEIYSMLHFTVRYAQ